MKSAIVSCFYNKDKCGLWCVLRFRSLHSVTLPGDASHCCHDCSKTCWNAFLFKSVPWGKGTWHWSLLSVTSAIVNHLSTGTYLKSVRGESRQILRRYSESKRWQRSQQPQPTFWRPVSENCSVALHWKLQRWIAQKILHDVHSLTSWKRVRLFDYILKLDSSTDFFLFCVRLTSILACRSSILRLASLCFLSSSLLEEALNKDMDGVRWLQRHRKTST